MSERELLVEVTTASPSDSRKAAVVRVRVEDRVSGEPIVCFELGDSEWWRLITGSSKYVAGFVGDHPDRIGRRMIVGHLDPERGEFDRRASVADLVAWAKERDPSWEEYAPRQTNKPGGWTVILRRWQTAAEVEATAEVRT